MIKITQERKLINGFRALNIKDDTHNTECRKDVLRVFNNEGTEIFLLDIEKDGTISIWSNEFILYVDKDI